MDLQNITYYHFDSIMPEDVSVNSPVDVIMKLDRFQIRYLIERSEMTLVGRIDTNVRLTIFSDCDSAESEAKFQRVFPFMNQRNGVYQQCQRVIVTIQNVHEVQGNYFYHTAYPGSIRAYSVPYRPLRGPVQYPLQELDISSTYNNYVPFEQFPENQIEHRLANDIIYRFNL